MLNNYYTLLHLSIELNDSLSGARILQPLTRSKNKLEIFFDGTDENMVVLVVSCLPQENFVYMENSPGRKPRGANVLPEIIGKVVARVGIVPNERQLTIEFSGHSFLRINLFGSAANTYYTDSDGVVINSFLKPGSKYRQEASNRS